MLSTRRARARLAPGLDRRASRSRSSTQRVRQLAGAVCGVSLELRSRRECAGGAPHPIFETRRPDATLAVASAGVMMECVDTNFEQWQIRLDPDLIGAGVALVWQTALRY